MSRGSRIAIGIMALIGSWGLWTSSIATSGVRASPWVFQLFSLVFVVIAFACVLPQAHRVTLRIIGAAIFTICFWYAIDSWHSGKDGWRSSQALWVFGAPAAYLMVTGRYPVWGRWSVVFNPPPPAIAPPPLRTKSQVAPVKPPVKRSRPRKSWKLSDFSVRRLTIGGWLLFLPSSGIFGLGVLVGLSGFLATKATQIVRIECWITAIVLMAIAIGFFWLGKVILGWLGVAVVKD
jgi:hypothetical protein